MNKPEYFRGRKVNYSHRYPRVWWPEHPVANKGGLAYIHRIIAYEKKGDVVFEKHVHHNNSDKYDWSEDNLNLLSPSEHSVKHCKEAGLNVHEPVGRVCPFCWAHLHVKGSQATNDNTFCSVSCSSYYNNLGKTKIDWPPTEELVERAKEIGFLALARELGVTDNTIRKRIKNH